VIAAAGLTPAWQEIACFEQLQLGEVNRAAEVHWCASGKVLNVGLALSHLGADVRTIAPLGSPPREATEREFAELGCPLRSVAVESPTRVCTTLLDRASGKTTELVENAHPLSAAELEAFHASYREEASAAEFVVLSGSLPASTPEDFYRRLIEATPARVVLDARGPELVEALAARPFVVKPNREELSRTVGRPLENENEVLAAMRQLNEAGAEWVLVTAGAQAVWATGDGGVLRFVPPRMSPIVNPIGCGDCLAAGLAWALAEGHEMDTAIRLAMAAAADNLQQLLPARLDRVRVRALAEMVEVTRR